MKDFIQVKYTFFNTENQGGSLIKAIRTEGFLLYHYLLYEQGNKTSCNVTIKMIQEFLNRNYNDRPKIKQNKNRHTKISVLKDKKTIVKYLKILVNNNMINIHNSIPNGINTSMIIQCNKEDSKGFEAFPNQLFIDKIHRIGHIGFTILCLLGKLFNSNYGSISCEGFANPTEEYISSVINRDIKTVRGYLYLLQKENIIKIINQTPIIIGCNEHNEPIYEFTANHYVVKYKLEENKYYLG